MVEKLMNWTEQIYDFVREVWKAAPEDDKRQFLQDFSAQDCPIIKAQQLNNEEAPEEDDFITHA